MVRWTDWRPPHVALLAGAVLLVAVNWEISDIAVIRWRETVGDTDFEYPVLARVIYLGERAITGSRTAIGVVNAILGVGLAVVVTHVLRNSDANIRMWALSPTLLLVGQNVDALTALLIALAFLAWRQDRITTTGGLVGIGTALKVAPAAILPPLLAASERRRALNLALVAGGTWLVLNGPYALADPTAWAFPYRFASLRDDVRGSIWAALPVSQDAVNVLSGLATLLATGWVSVLVARRRVTPATGVALALLGFIVSNKVWQPHYLLWLLPVLAFLSVPLRPVRVLEVTNLAFFLAVWLKLDESDSGALYWVSGTTRLLAATWLAVVLFKADDLVRARSPRPEKVSSSSAEWPMDPPASPAPPEPAPDP